MQDVLGKIAGRARPARFSLDYGFDPAQSVVAAQDAHRPGLARFVQAPDVPSDLDTAGLNSAEVARLTQIPKLSLSARQLRTANAGFLKAKPDQIFAIVPTARPVFTEADIRRALRERLGHVMDEQALLVPASWHQMICSLWMPALRMALSST